MTRREALVGGSVAIAAGFGLWGRFALGGTFEDHLAEQLGLSRELTDELIAAARDEIGSAEFEARAAAFTVATTFPGREVIPKGLRERAVNAQVRVLFEAAFGPPAMPLARDQLGGDNLGGVYAGLRPSIHIEPCEGLIER